MRSTLIIFILVLFAGEINSQTQGNFEMGIYSGVEGNFVSSSNRKVADCYTSIPGFAAGIRLQYHFNSRFSLIGGFDYSHFSFQCKVVPDDALMGVYIPSGILKYDVFKIPLLFQINIGSDKSKAYFNAGPTLMLCDVQNSRMYAYSFGSVPEVVNYLNIGGNFGCGYSFSPKPWIKFFGEATFILPLIASESNGYYSREFTRTLTLGGRVGVSFRFHKPKWLENQAN